jgi:hypothetical protein
MVGGMLPQYPYYTLLHYSTSTSTLLVIIPLHDKHTLLETNKDEAANTDTQLLSQEKSYY